MTIPRNAGRALGDETAFIAALKVGDEAAYEELVRTRGGRMLAVARRFLRSEDDARDAVQDAFLNAFRAIDRFEGNAQLSTWLHRIVVNAALLKLRTRRRRPEQAIEELLPGFLENGHLAEPASEWEKPPEDRVSRAEIRELGLSKVHELPEGHRNVLLLRDVEEYDTEETAGALDVSRGAVKTRLHRARMALRKLLEPHLKRSTG